MRRFVLSFHQESCEAWPGESEPHSRISPRSLLGQSAEEERGGRVQDFGGAVCPSLLSHTHTFKGAAKGCNLQTGKTDKGKNY